MAIQQLLSRRDAARILGVGVHTLAVWAGRGFGPPVVKVGSRAMYDADDLTRFIESRKRASTFAPFAKPAA